MMLSFLYEMCHHWICPYKNIQKYPIVRKKNDTRGTKKKIDLEDSRAFSIFSQKLKRREARTSDSIFLKPDNESLCIKISNLSCRSGGRRENFVDGIAHNWCWLRGKSFVHADKISLIMSPQNIRGFCY